jgi:hypothetical protein
MQSIKKPEAAWLFSYDHEKTRVKLKTILWTIL